MESTPDSLSFKPIPAEEPELDLYTIPSYSNWFSWDDIHETEKVALKEFFDGSWISRTPRIYKEYRDFIINKYREEPSRRLTFTEIRKSLVGDVNLLHKVFLFLEKWGLINFGAPKVDDLVEVSEGDQRCKVRFEEGAPVGVRVVAVPNSLRPVLVPPSVVSNRQSVENGFKLPKLASYSDVFGDLPKQKGLVCGNCEEKCDSGHYKCTKESFVICVKCFKNGKYGENKSLDDYKFVDCIDNSGKHGAVWTEAETLLLLESVLKHGNDWDLVAQNVKTKSKLDCISKLIQLPFGEIMVGSAKRKGNPSVTNGSASSVKQDHLTSSESQESIKAEEKTEDIEQNGDRENKGPPLKRKCIAGNSLMKQVAHITTMVSPHITAAAAEAAVTALCHETQFPREMFDSGEDDLTNEIGPPALTSEAKRALQVEESEMKERPTLSETQGASPEKNGIPLTLQYRAAVATALGAAAARAKLLADQEEREMEHLMATIIETQLKKLECKIKVFDDLEAIMEKEYSIIEKLEESIADERIDVLQRAYSSGISRWRNFSTSVKASS